MLTRFFWAKSHNSFIAIVRHCIRSISCICWWVQFHIANLSLLISNLAWYSWLIRMAWSSSNSPPAPCLFQLRSLRLPGTAAVGTQSMGKCETDQKRDTLAVSTGWQLGLTIGNNVVIYMQLNEYETDRYFLQNFQCMTKAQLLSLLWQKFLTEPFFKKFYFLFLKILISKQMRQVSLFSF